MRRGCEGQAQGRRLNADGSTSYSTANGRRPAECPARGLLSLSIQQIRAERGEPAGEDDAADHLEQADDPGDAQPEGRPLHPPGAVPRHQIDDEEQGDDAGRDEEELDGAKGGDHGVCTSL